jgi:hypothetical protein
LLDRARSGRPPKITCELEQHLNRLVDQDGVTGVIGGKFTISYN